MGVTNISLILALVVVVVGCTLAVIVGGVGSVEERRSLAGGLSLSCARPAADG